MIDYPEIWNKLFAAGDSQIGERMLMRTLRRNGHPFLLLPGQPRGASACLSLYPAQTLKARLARSLLRQALKFRLPTGAATISLPIQSENNFLRFLESLVPGESPVTNRLGILAGNPGGTGQRLIVLVFNQEFEPIVAVKTGLTPEAKRLVAKERDVLEALPAAALGKPEIRAVFKSDAVEALALPFYHGESPKGDQSEKIFGVLGSWLSRTRKSPIITTETWRRLRKSAANEPLMKALEMKLGERESRLALWHGDFAPWNIKVHHGQWIVLDWERGEANGIAGWDWFHYEVQTAILGRKESTDNVVQRLELLLGTRFWRDYARMAEIAAFERELCLAYLAYCVHVIQPSEGLKETNDLIRALSDRWGVLKS